MSRWTTIKLTQRDKRALLAGAVLILVFAVVFGWVLPAMDQITRLDRAIAAERQRLQEVRKLSRAVEELREREAKVQDQLKRRTAEAFSVASVIEGMARDSQIMEQVQYLKPEQAKLSDQYREASVALKVVEITPGQLVDFLYRVESSERILRVRNLQIRTNSKEANKLDVALTVFTLLPATAPVKSAEPEEATVKGPEGDEPSSESPESEQPPAMTPEGGQPPFGGEQPGGAGNPPPAPSPPPPAPSPQAPPAVEQPPTSKPQPS